MAGVFEYKYYYNPREGLLDIPAQKGLSLGSIIYHNEGLASECADGSFLVDIESPIDLEKSTCTFVDGYNPKYSYGSAIIDQDKASIQVRKFLHSGQEDACNHPLCNRIVEMIEKQNPSQKMRFGLFKSDIEYKKTKFLSSIVYNETAKKMIVRTMHGEIDTLSRPYGISSYHGHRAIAVITGVKLGWSFVGLFSYPEEESLCKEGHLCIFTPNRVQTSMEQSKSCGYLNFKGNPIFAEFSQFDIESVQLPPGSVGYKDNLMKSQFLQFDNKWTSDPSTAIPMKYVYDVVTGV